LVLTLQIPMKIVLVIHGYPMRYNAGSEVYTQTLAQALADRHEVHVFSRQQHKFLPDYVRRDETDPVDPRVRLHLVNMAQSFDQYQHSAVDEQFALLLDQVQPDIVHIGHLSHLSTSLVFAASQRAIPLIFTLHDYWLMCPRGQFLQVRSRGTDLWPLCSGQDDHTCAERCYARSFSGAPEEEERDLAYWTHWVQRRMQHIREVCAAIDLFIAPSHTLLNRFRDEFGLPADKLRYLNYGFQRAPLQGRSRTPGEPFTFGYIGTHVPAKGVNQLIEAFACLSGQAHLRIWGRTMGTETDSLRALVHDLPLETQQRISWMGEYRNAEIVAQVFNACDAIVVPSIWMENAPLVIHEALQARVPVITANAGGMAEYVQHECNGLLFAHRQPAALAEQMQRFLHDPTFARRLGERGYLDAPDGNIPVIAEQVRELERLYDHLRIQRKELHRHGSESNDTSGSVAHHFRHQPG
jgi:glycosyltransferase involved in cell wall biosynthesis